MAEKPDPRLAHRFLETYLDGLPGHAIEVRSRLEARPLYSRIHGQTRNVARRIPRDRPSGIHLSRYSRSCARPRWR
jgi:hypothetical protein